MPTRHVSLIVSFTFPTGGSISEEQIAAWADEAERGYDIAALKRRGRPRIGSGVAQVSAIRLDPELDAALTERAQADHVSRSEVVRNALRSWLSSAS